jgi:hypothetical protein
MVLKLSVGDVKMMIISLATNFIVTASAPEGGPRELRHRRRLAGPIVLAHHVDGVHDASSVNLLLLLSLLLLRQVAAAARSARRQLTREKR